MSGWRSIVQRTNESFVKLELLTSRGTIEDLFASPKIVQSLLRDVEALSLFITSMHPESSLILHALNVISANIETIKFHTDYSEYSA